MSVRTRTVLVAAITVVGLLAAAPTPSAAEPSKRDKSCGSFSVPGLLTRVQVKITDGAFPCKVARRVMDDLFHGRDTGNWDCVGPQTGYARCDKPNRGTVVGRF